MKTCLLLLLTAPFLSAQSEAELQRFFEGKRVRVRMDMPATHEGADYHFGKEPPLDFHAYSNRLRRYGAALRNGDEVMVTRVKVKDRNIEFHLGGGGYGVFGDPTGTVTARSVPKSSREKQLERDVSNERDPRRRDRMQAELSDLRRRREREERRERDEARRLTEMRKPEIEEKRLQAGSRFNLHFPQGRLKEAVPTPRQVMEMLAEWVDFGAMQGPR